MNEPRGYTIKLTVSYPKLSLYTLEQQFPSLLYKAYLNYKMTKCAVKTCKNNTATTRKDNGVTYHRFPQNYVMREKWRKIIAKSRHDECYKPTETSIICSEHFLESELYDTKKGFRRLKRTAYPHIQKTATQSETPQCIKNAQKIIAPIVAVNVPNSHESMEPECTVKDEKDMETQNMEDQESSISGTSSIVDTPQTKQLKKELKKCHSRINMKNRQIDNLKKQNKRLLKKNLCLRNVIQDMKKLI